MAGADPLDELYAAPPDEFVAVRKALAAEARNAGDREQASRIAAARKPTLPVWAVNQLARSEAKQVGRLVAAAERLGKAQASGRGEAFEKAQAELNEALRSLLRAIRSLLESHGRPPSDAVVERAGRTLRAAASRPDAREALTRGRLTEELEPAGFEGIAFAPPSSPRTAPPAARPSARERREAERAAKREAELARLREELEQAETEAREARLTAERAERRAQTLRARLERASA